MKEGPVTDITEALRTAQKDFQTLPLDQPRKTSAIVADLIADPHRDSSAELTALRTLLLNLHDSQEADERLTREEAIARSVADGATREATRRVMSAIEDAVDLPLARSGAAPPNWRWAAVFAAVVAAVVLTLARPDPADETPVSTVATTSTDASTTATAEPTTLPKATIEGVLAEFPTVKEGQFLVERGWRVTPGASELVGLIRLTPNDPSGSAGIHRELAPPLAIPDSTSIEWNPVPNLITHHVASYTISLENEESFVIEFRVPLQTGETVTEVEVLAWFDAWKPAAESLRSVLGDSEEILEPILSTGSSE